MANYYCCTRTNYFSVTDPEKLKEIAGRILWDEGELSFLEEEDGRWSFGAYGSICGMRPQAARRANGMRTRSAPPCRRSLLRATQSSSPRSVMKICVPLSAAPLS